MKALLCSILLAVVSLHVAALTLADIEKAQKMGNWSVVRTVNPMDDKVQCTSIYKGNVAIQLTTRGLYVRVPGGIEAITLRYGEQPAREMRLATDMEKRVSVVIMDPSEVSTFAEQGRVRIQVLKVLRGLHLEDIDATGVREVLEHMGRGCPPPRP